MQTKGAKRSTDVRRCNTFRYHISGDLHAAHVVSQYLETRGWVGGLLRRHIGIGD